MNIIRHVCVCGVDSHDGADSFIDYRDSRIHTPHMCELPILCDCGANMATTIDPVITRLVNAVFDFNFQVWRNTEGLPLSPKPDWDHVCPICEGPAKMTSCDCYSEHHECLNCHSTFNVK